MTRKELHTVTQSIEPVQPPLPVLFPVKNQAQSDGLAPSYMLSERVPKHIEKEFRTEPIRSGVPPYEVIGTVTYPFIRVVRDEDVAAAEKILGAEYELLLGLLSLKEGFEEGDELQRERAFRKLEPYLKGKILGREHEDQPPLLARDPKWARTLFESLINARFEVARWVYWYWEAQEIFTPAILAPDKKTALFLRILLELATCPHCGRLFRREKSNVIYCTPAHRDAHRTNRARWRARHKTGGKK